LGNESLKHSLDRLGELLNQVKRKYGVRASLSRFISVLSEYPCPARCLQELTPNGEADKIDYFHIERHKYLVMTFTNRLIYELWKRGLHAEVACENKGRTGRGDVDIRPKSNPSMKIRVEIKGGESIGIEQVLRYIADTSVLVLCLPSRGDAISINHNQLSNQAYYHLKTIAEKAEILLNEGVNIRVPGPWCSGCRLDCSFSHKKNKDDKDLEKRNHADLRQEFLKSSENWGKSIDKAVELVISLLVKAEKTPSKIKSQTTGFRDKSDGGGEE